MGRTGSIFISYRRADTGGEAGRLYDRLCDRFGEARVFRDVDTIEPGARFPQEIDEQLSRCSALVALIGPRWLKDEGGGRSRLEDPQDFVRLEIATALRLGVPVIPTLIHNTPMPRAEDLPADLRPLTLCQALEIDAADFHDDVGRLIEILEPKMRRPSRLRALLRHGRIGRGAALLAGTLAIAGGAALGAWSVLERRSAPDPDPDPEPRPRFELRTEGALMTDEAVQALIVGWGFYSSASNPGGPGIENGYRALLSRGDPVVVDDSTGLMWEHGGSRRAIPGGWGAAAEYVAILNQRHFGGFSNWRLPTLEEALSLMEPEARAGTHMDPAFNALAAPFVWTADGSSDGGAWVVYYVDGFAVPERLDAPAYVRAVRSP
jgi:hypothetical protein